MILSRQRVGLSPKKQIALATTFADQAVIAMENVRSEGDAYAPPPYQMVIGDPLR
jgi:hypothetical protein